MWSDRVFVSRQREIRQLSTNFAELLDRMAVDRPLSLDPKLLDEPAEEEEESAEPPLQDDRALTIREHALLLLHEIDLMRGETHQLILWFRPALVKANPRLATLKSGIQGLYSFLESLRMRAERLLSIEQGT
jgi:hypothetical protein